MNIFEYATRNALSFPSSRGALSVEQLWTLPLTGGSVNLNSVAIATSKVLADLSQEDFVGTRSDDAEVKNAQVALDVVKHIIAVRKTEAEDIRKKRDTAELRKTLVGVLKDKEDEAFRSLTPEELRKKIAELG